MMTLPVVFVVLAVLGQTSGLTVITNIAKGGKVTQSSLYGPAVPQRAIDGSRASNWHQGSCSTTKRDKNPWWRLDLLKTYKINTVTITNRGDCCQKRIRGAEIRIGNSLNNNGNANPRCAVITPPARGTSKTYVCNGMEGRYINIVIRGRREHLTLCEVEVTGQPSGNTAPTDTNIAKGGKVTQSSLYGPAVPQRAIDGSRASNWHQGSCSTTKRDKNPWWRLDLLKTYKINTVTITNRGDCCQKRIKGAEIRIGNSLNDNGNANPRCAVITPPAHGTSKTYVCNGMEGRYINIVIRGRQEHLTLCEVEVTGQPSGNTAQTDTNIAKGGKVTQSSLYGPAVPQRAIDGSRASNWHQGSCSTTKRDKNPWWRLDLLKTYKINTVTITNRGDCCQKRIRGAEIRIGNSLNDNGNANPRCAVITPPAHGTSKTYACNGMEGRYINIVIRGRQEHLTLCEVEVTGQPSGNTAPTDTNIAKGGKVTQSSLYGPAVPQRAIDGSRASNWHQGSCSTTKRDKNPWWRLDLLKTYKINTVTITNRGDCCQKRIRGAEIRIGNSLNDNGNANPRCAVITPPAHGTSKTYVCNGMEGRYINIVIRGRQEHLTLCEVEVTGQPSGNTAQTDTNIAKGGKVTQSSLYGPAVPQRAIDGSRASNWHQGSCSTTKRDKNPWWRLDLLKTYKINTVTITNRGDCCQKRIMGAEIRIGNSLNDNGNANPRCAVITPPAHGTSKTYACNGMEGRYINIVIRGRQEHLTLCEVEVTGQPSGNTAPTDTNIAKGGKVTQSSLYGPAVPQRAIDGSRASNWNQGSCSTTKRDKNPWWRLDLLKTYKINTVTITNRGDCCQKRIKGAEIRIGNSLNDNGNANPRCAVITPPAHGTSKTYVCNGMEGRYINVVIRGRQEHLTLCEVEVTGQPSGNTAQTDTNIAKGGKVTQSSLYGRAVPERAIDGSRASNWYLGSCSTTKRDKNPWWRLDLLKTYKINTVTITNRGDCCQKRIRGAEIRIGNSLNDNGNANPRCAVITPPARGTSKTYVCNGMEGRYINIVIRGRQEHLTLCEVEVTGQPSGNASGSDDSTEYVCY